MATDLDPKSLTRKELAAFLPNQRAIRAFERLFELIPPDLNAINNHLSELRFQSVNIGIDYDVQNGNYLILVDASLGPVTITLPDVTSAFITYDDEIYYFVIGISKIDSSTNKVTVNCQVGQTIFSEASFDLLVKDEIVNVTANPDVGAVNWELAS